jgi:signal transduction histidine kinase/ActR/RegA family two-component response regulator
MDEFLDILAQFGGGRGDPANIVVRFLLPAVFWSILTWVSFTNWYRFKEKKDLYVLVAGIAGICREMIMFVAWYSRWKRYVPSNPFEYFDPPFEHAAIMLSGVLLGYAFISYIGRWNVAPRVFLKTGLTATIVLYLVTAPSWIAFHRENPELPFGSFWGDMAFRIVSAILLLTVLVFLVVGKSKKAVFPQSLFIGFGLLFLDEFLMVFNLATREVHAAIYAPIRHNLHIWAIPFFLAAYWIQLKTDLQESQKSLSRAQAMAHLGNWKWNLVTDEITCSDEVYRIFGLQPGSTEPSIEGFFHALSVDDQNQIKAIAAKAMSGEDAPSTIEHRIIRPDGSERFVLQQWEITRDPEGYPLEVVGTIQDITERRQARIEKETLERQLLQAQKMEAIGQLAGGVAHDFNNLLTVIRGYIELVMMQLQKDDALYRDLKIALESTIRAAKLTHQLLLYSRRQPMQLSIVNINQLVENLLKMLRRLLGENITIRTDFAPDLWGVKADEGNLEQVTMNLAVNARDAMPNGGDLIIKTENVTLDKASCAADSEARPGRFVCLAVSDTGIGMDQETLQHIFEPFFTTKEKGRGTGMGLSVVYGIVKHHGGWIRVHSELGRGTTFEIFLPASSEKALDRPEEEVSLQEFQGNGQRILVVEDESAVREFAAKTLGENGYVVYEAANAEEALRIFEREKGQFQLIFSDVILPGKSGLELIKRLRSLRPDLPVLLASGYTGGEVQWATIRREAYPFIWKPYTVADLLRNTAKVLQQSGASSGE